MSQRSISLNATAAVAMLWLVKIEHKYNTHDVDPLKRDLVQSE